MVAFKIWSKAILSKVMSVIGVFLYLDKISANRARLSYAKIFVELTTSEPPQSLLTYSLKKIMSRFKI